MTRAAFRARLAALLSILLASLASLPILGAAPGSGSGTPPVLTGRSVPPSPTTNPTPNPPSIPAPDREPPPWVFRSPLDPDRWFGIGRADKRRHPEDYRERAQAMALAQISREISLRIRTTETEFRSEDARGPEESFSAKTVAESENDLIGYERADAFETGEGFWVLYSLDRERYRKARAERERRVAACLERESKAGAIEMEARRLQAAADRLAGMARTCGTGAASEGPPDGVRLPPGYQAFSESVRTAAAEAEWSAEPKVWEFSLLHAPGSEWARVRLIDPRTRLPWQGPLRLLLRDGRRAHPEECPIETDDSGSFRLDKPFLVCGLSPRNWSVAWDGIQPGMWPGMRPGIRLPEKRMGISASWKPFEVSLSVQADGGGIPIGTGAALRSEIESIGLPWCRFVPPRDAIPILCIRVREAELDSLDGMYFASLRGEIVIPGLPGSTELRGKAGHSDPSRARSGSIRDLVRKIAALPAIRSE